MRTPHRIHIAGWVERLPPFASQQIQIPSRPL